MSPLPDEELEAWHQYLDFIEKDKDIDKVVKLFERCLIACGNYPEYWIRYVISMEQNGKIELANSALDRATQVFVKRKPAIHLFAARIKEQNGDIAGSRAAYQLVHSEISPGHLEAVTKHANMEKRQGHLDPAFAVYEQVISVEKGIRNSKLLPLLYVQYSKFKYLVSGDAKGAKNILVEALAHVKASKPFIETLLSVVSIMPEPTGIAKLEAFIEEFIEDTQNATSIEREEVSMIYIAFLDMCRVDHNPLNEATKKHAKTLNEAANKHAKLFPWSSQR